MFYSIIVSKFNSFSFAFQAGGNYALLMCF